MNKTVELVNEWASFEETHPNATIEDFCRFFLIFRSKREVHPKTMDKEKFIDEKISLIRTLHNIIGAYLIYNKLALSTTEIPFPDGFFYLTGLKYLDETKKTDLINAIFAEYTTGMEAINRLIKLGLIDERIDPNDRRAKLIKLTEEGKRVLYDSFKEVRKVPHFLFAEMTAEEIKLCLQLLSPVIEKHTHMAIELKNTGKTEFFSNLEFEEFDNTFEKHH